MKTMKTMKTAKKAVALLTVMTLGVSMLAGCGTDETDENKTKSEEITETENTANTGADTDTDAAVTTVTEGKLTMATNAYFPPYEYYDGEEIVGIDVEIAEAIAEKLGLELVIEDMEFDSIITAVQKDKADLGLAGMTVTEDRLENVDFSDSYATGIQAVIVKEDSDIASIDDLDGKKIGVQLATTGDIYAVDDYGQENVDEYNKGADAVMALVSGKVDCVIIDNEPAKSFVAANEGLKILDTEYAVEDYAACIKKDNTALLDAVNEALTELKEDGTLQEIVDKYISSEQ